MEMKVKHKFIFLGALVITSGITQAQAADGCKFMLCMGAVNPMGIAECASTVKEVLHDLKKGRGFPTCKMSNGLDSKTSGSFVTPTRASYTPRCPNGTKQGQDGVIYHEGNMPRNARWLSTSSGVSNQLLTDSVFNHGEYSRRVCVSGKQLGSVAAYNWGDEPTPPQEWWEKVQVMNPDCASYQFDFFIDNQLYSSHRF